MDLPDFICEPVSYFLIRFHPKSFGFISMFKLKVHPYFDSMLFLQVYEVNLFIGQQ